MASGRRVVADVGGNLNVESLQDTSTYDSKQKSLGGSVTFGPSLTGSVNFNKSKIKSNYASVTEQSGLKAGDEGFQVIVKGDTDLKGAVIASTEQAVQDGKNSLSTGTLTTSDIENHADYSAKSVGVNMGSSLSLDGKLAPSGTSAGFGKDSGNAGSITRAGISGMAGNKDARTGDLETGIAKIFDADKVQKEINAQVQITRAFGLQASKAVGDYAQGQRKTLQEQLKNATTETEKTAIQTQLSDLAMQERVMNVLIGAVTGTGVTALTKETLSAAADQMRQLMIEDSKKFAGVTDGETTLTNLLSGKSEGVRGDKVGIGGTRIDLDLLCGTGNERCKTQEDASGNKIYDENGIPKLELNVKGQVQFDPTKAGAGMTLAKFLETEKGQKLVAITGGIQGWKGTLFGVPYAAGSWQDKLIESFAGTHDMIGGKLSGLYDEQGNAKRGMTGTERTAHETWAAVAIAPSTPFAMAELVSPEVWKAISILLGAAK